MDDSLLVGLLERLADLPGDGERLRNRQRSLGDPLRERLSLGELHHDGADGAGLLDAIDLRDVRVVQRRQQVRLALETSEAVRVVGEQVWQDLYGDLAPEPHVTRPVDFSHASCAEGGQDLVRPEARTGRDGHDGAVGDSTVGECSPLYARGDLGPGRQTGCHPHRPLLHHVRSDRRSAPGTA
jgi:hypothetical protein